MHTHTYIFFLLHELPTITLYDLFMYWGLNSGPWTSYSNVPPLSHAAALTLIVFCKRIHNQWPHWSRRELMVCANRKKKINAFHLRVQSSCSQVTFCLWIRLQSITNNGKISFSAQTLAHCWQHLSTFYHEIRIVSLRGMLSTYTTEHFSRKGLDVSSLNFWWASTIVTQILKKTTSSV